MPQYIAFIQRIVDNIQSGNGFNRNITTDKLAIAARTKYNNMIEDKPWSKVDPHNAKIMALTTKLKLIEKAKCSGGTALATDGANPVTGHAQFTTIEEWRKKKEGDTKEMHGRTWYWCPNHKGKDYNSMYISLHKPSCHDDWSKDRGAACDGCFTCNLIIRLVTYVDDCVVQLIWLKWCKHMDHQDLSVKDTSGQHTCLANSTIYDSHVPPSRILGRLHRVAP